MALPIEFAPLEGVTDAVFRRTHRAHFPGVSKYFIPFISPTQNLRFTARELSAISPERNAGLFAVPQILTKDAGHFLWAAQALFDMGYGEINLNAGCPSGTVTAKGKGTGLLADVSALSWFLDEVFAHAPLKVSIKTRIGITRPEEFAQILEVYARYPVHELIIHPRTRSEMYKGTPHRDVYGDALAQTKLPIVYNGDLFTAADCRALESTFSDTKALMLGRGLIANPALARAYMGGAPLRKDELRVFHDDLLRAYLAEYPAHVALGRMREVMKHVVCCFEHPEKPRKAIRKAAKLSAYEDAVSRLFDEHALREDAGFISEE